MPGTSQALDGRKYRSRQAAAGQCYRQAPLLLLCRKVEQTYQAIHSLHNSFGGLQAASGGGMSCTKSSGAE